jgi:hypothetical protein
MFHVLYFWNDNAFVNLAIIIDKSLFTTHCYHSSNIPLEDIDMLKIDTGQY